MTMHPDARLQGEDDGRYVPAGLLNHLFCLSPFPVELTRVSNEGGPFFAVRKENTLFCRTLRVPTCRQTRGKEQASRGERPAAHPVRRSLLESTAGGLFFSLTQAHRAFPEGSVCPLSGNADFSDPIEGPTWPVKPLPLSSSTTDRSYVATISELNDDLWLQGKGIACLFFDFAF